MSSIRQNVSQLIGELPGGVQLLAAVKGRQLQEVIEAIESGVKIIGENYIQEAQDAYRVIGKEVEWHFIGHLQKNKVKKAVLIFDVIETIDSLDLAREIDRRCARMGKVMPVLVEINSGREERKTGVLPEDTEKLIREISSLGNVRVMGLMTMGPRLGDPAESRPYFIETKKIFDRIRSLKLPNVEMKYLSMGMSNSYKVAIEEGASIVRIGSKIFGERD